MQVQCLQPLVGQDPVLLILGTMPGNASLSAKQYYAHPRNSFWKILTDLRVLEEGLTYEQRISALTTANIAVWDVISTCVRPGSLDANIEKHGLMTNDFQRFFSQYQTINQVFFNGSQAEQCFNRFVRPTLNTHAMTYCRLPSTSPANASISYPIKLEAWRAILQSNNAIQV